MLYKEYGKTGKKISILGFGGLKFDKNDLKENDMSKSVEAVRCAYENGINIFDSAPTYSDGLSESVYGAALSIYPRESYYLSSKNSTINTGDRTESDFRKRLETSLERFKTDRIDFYYLWFMRDWDCFIEHTVKNKEYMKFLIKAKDEKLIDHICFSSHADCVDTKKMVDTGMFDGVLLSHNILKNNYYHDLLGYIYNKNMGTMAMNPLGGGAIPRNSDYFRFLEIDGLNIVQSALRYVFSNKYITSALSGMTSKEEVINNIRAADKFYSDDEIDFLNDKITCQDSGICTLCKYCDVCPVDIPVYKYMESYNIKILFDGYSVKRQLNEFWNIRELDIDKCIKCGKCENMCTQKLPILKRFEEYPDLK